MGVTGQSVLASIPEFDVINGFCIDAMHAVFEGVVRDLLSRIVDNFTKQEIQIFDARLLSIQVPAEVARTTRPVADFRSGKWRVSELHTVLFLAPLLIRQLVRDRELQCFELLAIAMHSLHSTVVSQTCLKHCKRLIAKFCKVL